MLKVNSIVRLMIHIYSAKRFENYYLTFVYIDKA